MEKRINNALKRPLVSVDKDVYTEQKRQKTADGATLSDLGTGKPLHVQFI